MKTAKKDQPENNWQVLALRFTTFQKEFSQLNDMQLWKSVIGEDPNQRIQNKNGVYTEEGIVESGNFRINMQPGRIDFIFSSIENNTINTGNIKTLGLFDDVIKIFLTPIQEWNNLDSAPISRRIAFGALLIQNVENKKRSYEKLSSYLPYVKLDVEKSSDFFYQINRPRESLVVEGLSINRLSKWSAIQQQLVSVELISGSRQISDPSYACQLELDINTSQKRDVDIDREVEYELFRELMEFGKEISVEGDIE